MFLNLMHYDVIEIVCSIVATHLLLNTLYKKYGTRCYTISYGTALCIVTSWIVSYKIISTVIFIAAMIRLLLSFLETQRYLAAPPARTIHEKNDWIETIISLSIQAFHEDISLTWLIDYEDQLHESLHAEINLQVYLVPKLSTIIFNTINTTTKTSILWVNRHGYLVGINPGKGTTQESPTLNDITTWSKHNGVIMLQSYAQKRMYTILHRGMMRDNLSSHHAFHMIKQILLPQQAIHTQELL